MLSTLYLQRATIEKSSFLSESAKCCPSAHLRMGDKPSQSINHWARPNWEPKASSDSLSAGVRPFVVRTQSLSMVMVGSLAHSYA